MACITREPMSPTPSHIDDSNHDMEAVWIPPPMHSFKINVENSHRSSLGYACGGVVRDHTRFLIKGFFCNLEMDNAILVELWGLYLGLKLARILDLHFVIFESDSLFVIHVINMRYTNPLFLKPILDYILRLLDQRDWCTLVVHTYLS